MSIDKYDEKAYFEKYCRKPGTRCNKIMQMIETGGSNQFIANKFNTIPSVIEVYRRAYNGTLSKINHDNMPSTEW